MFDLGRRERKCIFAELWTMVLVFQEQLFVEMYVKAFSIIKHHSVSTVNQGWLVR